MESFVGEVMTRWSESWARMVERKAAREAAGVQPEFPYATLQHIVAFNIVYFIITTLLYSRAKRQIKAGAKTPLGPAWLSKVIFVYNLICVGLAGYVVVEIVRYKLFIEMGTFACNEDERTDPEQVRLGWAIWVFYIQKYWEFLDTWFFLLRGSLRQVTFLHVFHHSSITVVVGTILPYSFSGDLYLPVLLNAFVHVIMYSYYALTTLKIPFPWKRYLTSMQLIQFVLIFSQNVYAWTAGPSCGVPDFAKVMLICYMISMLVLFGNFFVQSYIKKDPKKKDAVKKQD